MSARKGLLGNAELSNPGLESTTKQRANVGFGIRRESAMKILRSWAFDAAWILWTAPFGIVIPVLWLLGSPPKAVRKFTRIWARGVLFGLSWIVGLDFREEGRSNIPPEPCLIICNHQSVWETLAALVLFPEVSIIAKDELLGIPILGWFLKNSPMIVIARGSAASSLRKMKVEGAAALSEGRSVLIFPEGTRKSAHEQVHFKRGVELLYGALGAKVLPVVVDSGKFWGVGGSLKKPGTITVSYLPVLEPGLDITEFARDAEFRMQAERARQLMRNPCALRSDSRKADDRE
ncbi:lysophospholipid acyltransferase family protein [Novosphingobium pentaromativorans]|nr:lysophospholipid acyltransferase family protein [Novosphingobium pentaromativorans]